MSSVIPDEEKTSAKQYEAWLRRDTRNWPSSLAPAVVDVYPTRGRCACCLKWVRNESPRFDSTEPTVEGGRLLARNIRASGATAVIAYNDLVAIGLMQELQAAGVSVPDGLSIVDSMIFSVRT
ncbi:hypothetical protein ABIE37_000137 [Arthrobacter bambusae]|uniref:Transcriptional regulator LacI/GalR-like sensor domain-containing protein n=1 Tax=Arthrobacter bambusae TaxID=1338426 RepID=A0ABV2P108_9MICC